MAFDILSYRDKYKDYYKGKSLDEVAQDVYSGGGFDKSDDYDTWKKNTGIDSVLEEDRRRRNPTFTDKLANAVGLSESAREHIDKDRGFLGDVASRGARGVVQAAKQVGGAMRMMDFDATSDEGLVGSIGKKLTDFAAGAEKYDLLKPDLGEVTGKEGFVKRGFMGAIESTPASLLPFAAGVAGGFLTGGPVGAFIAGGATLFGTFGLGEYQNTFDETVKQLREQGVPEDQIGDMAHKHSLTTAVAEAGGEVVGDLAALTFFGALGKKAASQAVSKTIKELVSSGGIKEFMKAVAKQAPFEAGSEMGTAYIQTESARKYGLTDMSTGEAVAESILPAVFMSLMFGGSIRGMQAVEAHNLYKKLNSQNPMERSEAAVSIAQRMDDQESQKTWLDTADKYIEAGQEIPLSQPIVDFATQKTAQDAMSKEEQAKETFRSGIVNAVDKGISAGEYEGKPFTPDHALELIKRGQDEGVFTPADLDTFKDKYPQLKDGLNVLIAENITKKVDEVVTNTVTKPATNTATEKDVPINEPEIPAVFKSMPIEELKKFADDGNKFAKMELGTRTQETPDIKSLEDKIAKTEAFLSKNEKSKDTKRYKQYAEKLETDKAKLAELTNPAKKELPAPEAKQDRGTLYDKEVELNKDNTTDRYKTPVTTQEDLDNAKQWGASLDKDTIIVSASGPRFKVMQSKSGRKSLQEIDEDGTEVGSGYFMEKGDGLNWLATSKIEQLPAPLSQTDAATVGTKEVKAGESSKQKYYTDNGSVGSFNANDKTVLKDIADKGLQSFDTFEEADAARKEWIKTEQVKKTETKKAEDAADYSAWQKSEQTKKDNDIILQEFSDLQGKHFPDNGAGRNEMSQAFSQFRKENSTTGNDWWDKPLEEKQAGLKEFEKQFAPTQAEGKQPLIEKARKYKTAEEFVKAQNNRYQKISGNEVDGRIAESKEDIIADASETIGAERLTPEVLDANAEEVDDFFNDFSTVELTEEELAFASRDEEAPRTETTAAGKQVTIPGASESETFSLTAKEPVNALAKGAKLTPQNLQPKEKNADMFGEKEAEEKEPARLAAIGKITGSRVDRAEAKGYEFAYGPSDKETKDAMVGMFAGNYAERLIDAGITIVKTQKETAVDLSAKSDYGSKNTIFTEDKAAKARAILKEKLKGTQLSVGIDPEILTAGIDLAGYHIEAGARKFTDYAKAMIDDIGDTIKPYLKSLYLAVRNYPGVEKNGMNTEAEIDVIDIDSAVTGQKSEASPYGTVADKVAEKLSKKEKFTRNELFFMCKDAFGGTLAEGKFSAKDAYDAMEMGINKRIEELGVNPRVPHGYFVKKQIDKLNDLFDLIPTQTTRTEEMDEFQQFSTPPALAYVANWVANLKEKDVYLEPSAGTGNLVTFARIAGVKETIVNELAPRRAAILKELGFDKVYSENAEQINNILPEEIRPTVVVMNPPFSSTAGRMKGKTDSTNITKHIEQCLLRLQPGGRLVAITGEGMTENKASLYPWWKKIEKQYNIRANIGIDGQAFAKMGTSFGNQIIVIDKPKSLAIPKENDYNIIKGKVNKIEDLINLLEGVRNERINPAEQREAQSGEQEGAVIPQKETGRDGAVLPATGGVVTKEQPGRSGRAADNDAGRNEGLEPGGRNELSGKRAGNKRAEGRSGLESGQQRSEGTGRSNTAGDTRQSDNNAPVLSEEEVSGLTVEQRADVEKNDELTDAVYNTYTPAKLTISNSKEHPGKLVESAAMASIEPIDPNYSPRLPEKAIKSGAISIAQLEAVVYAGQAHSEILPNGERKGYFIGDGTGVGKGREIAAILWDNWNQGRRKAVWLSQNSPLMKDAQRDIAGVGWDKGLVFDIQKTKLKESIKHKEGIGFVGYGTLRTKKVVSGKEISRLNQFTDWLGKDFDGVIVFDESHNMGNALPMRGRRGTSKPSATALAGIELQKQLPKARVVYVSATGATEVMNLAYAERLGLWGDKTPFPNATSFVTSISSGGITAMEMVAMNMKANGVYLARSLAYDDVKYERLQHDLTPEQRKIYDELAGAWEIAQRDIDAAMTATGITDEERTLNGEAKSHVMSAFWGTNQRFWNQIITSMQMPTVIKAIEKDIADGHAPLIQLINTNEAAQKRAISGMEEDDTLENLDITPKEMLIEYVNNSFPVHQFEKYLDEEGHEKSRIVIDSKGNPVLNAEAVQIREDLLTKLASIRVPDGPLEIVLDHFGIENAAEVTGRSRRVVYKDTKDGRKRVVEAWGKNKGMADADAFMNDKKKLLVFSQAGGTGRSYHADNTAKNKRLRRHYLIQPGWRADVAVQGLGRSHRTNQAQAPEWVLVTTDLEGQKRFISSIARRLSQLGALTKGSRETGNQGLFNSRDNLESQEAKDAFHQLLKDIYHNDVDGMTMGEFMDMTGLNNIIDKETGALNVTNLPEINQFLNRILNMKIDVQNKMFSEFAKRLNIKVAQAMENGSLDVGVETIRAKRTEKLNEQVVYEDPKTKAKATYLEVELTHDAKLLPYENTHAYNQYGYVQNIRSGRIWALAYQKSKTDSESGDVTPHYSAVGANYNYQDISDKDVNNPEKYKKIPKEEAKALWDADYNKMPKEVSERVHMVTGSILPIWDRLPQGEGTNKIYRLQVDGKNIIGRVIQNKYLDATLKKLNAQRKQANYKPQDIFNNVLHHGYAYELSNGWEIKRRKVADDYRIELEGPDYVHTDELKKYGIFTERISYTTRYFIPADEKGVNAIKEIISSRQVVEEIASGKKKGQVTTKDVEFMHDKGEYAIGQKGSFQLPTLAEVQDVFKGQKVTQLKNGAYYIETKAGANVIVSAVDEITPSKISLSVGYSKGHLTETEAIAGRYQKGMIDLVKGQADKWTLAHESVHFMEDIGVINDNEAKLLKRHIQNLTQEGKWETLNKDDIGGAEDRAEFLAQNLQKEPKGLLGRIINKIQEFIDKLVNVFGRTVRGITRDIKTGDIYGKETNEQREARLDLEGGLKNESKSANKYSVTKDKGTGDNIPAKENPTPEAGLIDKEYISSIKNNDAKSTQRIVEEAARKSGLIGPFFHGSRNISGGKYSAAHDPRQFDNFILSEANTQSQGLYLTPNEVIAKNYVGEKGELRKFFVKAENPFNGDIYDFYKPIADNALSRFNKKTKSNYASWKEVFDNGDYFEIEELIKRKIGDFDYDGAKSTTEARAILFVYGDKGAVSPGFRTYDLTEYGGYDAQNDLSSIVDDKQFIVFKPSQLIEGDDILYDEKGDIIPLSKRFQLPNPSRSPMGGGQSVKQTKDQYSIRKQTDPPVSKDPKVINSYIKDETDAIVQTIMNKLHPKSMTWLETILKSPEWFDHPQIQNIVRLFMRDRNELYHETFNDLNLAGDSTVTEEAKVLRNKGLSLKERLSGKVSPEYKVLTDMIDDGDTNWTRNKKIPLNQQLKSFEDVWRKKGATDEIISVWRSFRQSYDKALDLMTKQLRDMIAELTEEARSKGEVPDISELKQTLQGALADMEEWRGFYAPRQRERGNWAVQAYKEHGPLSQNREWHRAHKASELEARREAKRLEREGWKIHRVGEVEKLPEDIYQNVKTVGTAKLIDAALDKYVTKNKLGEDSAAKLNEEVLREVANMIKSRGFRGTMLHRGRGNVVRGFVEDPIERHIMYINSVAGGISKAKVARLAFNELLGEKVMGQQIGGIDPVKDPRAYAVAQDYIQEQLRNADAADRIIGLAKSITTFKFLGFNLRSLTVNTTAMVTTAPTAIHQYAMGGQGSMIAVFREIAKAGKDYAGMMVGRKLTNADEQAFIEEQHRKGWDDAQYTREALGEISKMHNKAWSYAMDASMWAFGKSEQWNRGATMLAAYRLARKQGLSHDEAAEKAKTSSDKAHGVYGKSTMPMWAQGTNPAAKVGQMMYVYSKFSHNYLQMLYDVGFKQHNIKGLMFAFLSPLVLAGGAAFPFKDTIFGIAGFILGLLGFDEDPEKWVWDQIREHLGGDAEKIGRHGLTGAMGIDISGSLSIGVGVPKNMIDLSGAIGGAAADIREAGENLMSGQYGRAAEHLLPTGIANPLRAKRETEQGVTTRNKRRVWDEQGKAYVPGSGATTARVLGFRSTEQAVLSERTWEGHRQQGKFADKRNGIYERYRAWLLGGRDREEYKKIVKEVQDFNAYLRKNNVKGESFITTQSLKNQVRRMNKPSRKERSILED